MYNEYSYSLTTLRKEKTMEKLIKRINELSKKSKAEGLTEEEKEEQAQLRKQYIQKFRQGLENTLSNVYIMDEKGNKKKVEKKK
jgi:uncharacterized protein YnzC (UPF0291/DUF896 family)